ncbi:MAG: PQQ-dependent sugar dehydrogenase [Pseudomonadota bacterium]
MYLRLATLSFLAVFSLSSAKANPPKISVPAGFQASVFAEGVGRARHIVVRPNGDVLVALQRRAKGAGVVRLKDTNGDGRADDIERFGKVTGTGMALYKSYLYFGEPERIVRFKLSDTSLPIGDMEVVVDGFPDQGSHRSKTIAISPDGQLFVNVGAPSNACQIYSREPEVKGQDPCPQLERQAGVWVFDADTLGQTQVEDGKRYVTGLRNAVAIEWHGGSLYLAQHGRDQLSDLWPGYFGQADNTEKPAEEFHRVSEGDDLGWPYTYFDPIAKERKLAPEYGGDGNKAPEAGRYKDPDAYFPAHWGPNDVVFGTSETFPTRYKDGAFVAFHGSWNRYPDPQGGYKVTFLPMKDGAPTGDYEVFANGFTGKDGPIFQPGDADARPTGLAFGPDGALYISDSVEGTIWRITYGSES